ncbi:MAG TPA: aminotransferase class I/II-fold pyridoxal phosphate-dependent enzyme [Kiritimatiellia bacterium]|nr:aminotransferase class I/II-fold pyridoxal phosphate-dependent enzyme [Kiritimatiellia bacterium]HNS80141.1 aminotransferase class I/II-fold pyridoxal phosphate-dependent enzyme [Kiritimatiellia bacterium]HPA77548.1 aminotransferase class I/II-fold pyridoxal phosphate-dependent enzyme [Kiritimatiellia bacterium]HQQ04204.1 aminotransferase class I/II-fold pyridoxal phosphate-dependent enzyme [Kiritimatiellia bacterium]
MSSSSSDKKRIAKLVREMPRSGIRDFFDIISTRHDIISLSIGEPEFETPESIRKVAATALQAGAQATRYTSNMGLLELRRALAHYVKKMFNAEYDPEKEILITTGVSEAMDLAMRAIVDPGDEVIYHEPAFVSYRPEILFAGGVPVPIVTTEEDGFRLKPELVEAAITKKTKALLLNFPNNPTGAMLSRQDFEKLAKICIKHDLMVITDEIYAELSYGDEYVSIASIPGMKERTIFLHGFSKAWAMTGFRMGYSCAPAALTEAMMKIHQYVMMSAPTISQIAAIEALSHAEIDTEQMRKGYQERRDFMYDSIREMGIPCTKPGGAFYMFPRVGVLGLSSMDFAMNFLNEESVAVVPGTAFGACGEGYVRCAYVASMQNLKLAMMRMKRFVDKLR